MYQSSNTSGYRLSRSGSSVKMPSLHYHDSYELYFLSAGNREYFVEDKQFSVATGDFILIPPGCLHRTGGDYGERILVNFTYSFMCKVFSTEALEELLQCFRHFKYTPTESKRPTFDFLLTQLLACKNDTETALAIGALLIELSKCGEQKIENNQIGRIAAYINQNHGKIKSISEIAEHFFISKYHLCRVFKNGMNVTVIEYLNKIRIKNACQLLSTSALSIGEISERCGYGSTAYFSNVFKRSTGQSPSAYRLQKNNQQ